MKKDNEEFLPPRRPYCAFLLRCWQEDESWRFLLESIGPQRAQQGFGRFEEVVAFIQSQLAEAVGEPDGRNQGAAGTPPSTSGDFGRRIS